MKLIIKNSFGLAWKNVELELFDVKNRSTNKITGTTNKEGIAVFHIKKGKFMIRVKARNFIKEQIVEIDHEGVTIKLNTIFGLFKKIEEISDEELCSFCKSEYKGFLDKFKCKYCKKNHCAAHRLPEKHNCTGNPRSPQQSYGVVYSKGNTSIYH